MVILTIVTTAIVLVWFALQDSYGYSTNSAKQREAARDGLSLLAREVRDVQPLALGSSTPPILTASPYAISFYTTFHDPEADSPEAASQLVDYAIMADDSDPDRPGRQALKRRIGGEGEDWRIVVSDVMNEEEEQPLFRYSYFDPSGGLQSGTSVDDAYVDRIVNVEIQLLIDLNPGHSPTEMKLTTTVQPRNLRST